MKDYDHSILVYTGSEMNALALKGMLEEAGISAMLHNEFRAGVWAGFVAGLPSETDLYIRENDLDTATPIIEDFLAGIE